MGVISKSYTALQGGLTVHRGQGTSWGGFFSLVWDSFGRHRPDRLYLALSLAFRVLLFSYPAVFVFGADGPEAVSPLITDDDEDGRGCCWATCVVYCCLHRLRPMGCAMCVCTSRGAHGGLPQKLTSNHSDSLSVGSAQRAYRLPSTPPDDGWLDDGRCGETEEGIPDQRIPVGWMGWMGCRTHWTVRLAAVNYQDGQLGAVP